MRHILFAVALAAGASPAAAQPTPWSPERITAGWVFTPAIVFGGMWDSNVTLSNEGNPATTELLGLVNPRGEIDFNGRRAKFTAGYSGTLEAYREAAGLTRYDQRGRMEARYQMTPRLGFITRQMLTITPTTEQLMLGLPFTRVGSRVFDAHGGFVHELSQRAKLTANYNFQWVNFDRAPESSPDFRFLLGGNSHSPELEATYKVARHAYVGGAWNYRHTSADGGEKVFDSQEAVAVVAITLGPATSVRGRGGLAHVRVSRTGEVQTGPSFGGGISHTAGRFAMDVSYQRSFQPAFGFGGLTPSAMFHAGVTAPFAHGRMFAAGGFTWRRTEPSPTQGITFSLDSYWTHSTFGYHIARWLRMEAFYALTHQASSAQGNVDRNRIGIQFVTSKPVRIQ